VQLAALIERIAMLAPNEVTGGRVVITIVDDSPTGEAQTVVDRLRTEVELELSYFNTASANISTARNRAIQDAMTHGEFVACLDDDCVPEPGWLRELLRVAAEREADIVVGHRVFFAGEGTPDWLSREPFLNENAMYPDGSVPTSGNTANVLIRSSWLASSGVRFRPELGAVGGEDMVFFADAATAGAEIRFAAGSTTNEPCDGRRASWRYQLWRQVWLGNNEAAINRATGAETSLRLLLRGTKRAILGAVGPVASTLRRGPMQWRWAVASSGRGVGLVLGVFGVRLRHRS
jgi:succinoglycan biosynthesis protein ExoM